MKRHLFAGALASVVLALGSCSQAESDKPGYKAGYEDGKSDERADMCSRIEGFSESIHTALENEGICG